MFVLCYSAAATTFGGTLLCLLRQSCLWSQMSLCLNKIQIWTDTYIPAIPSFLPWVPHAMRFSTYIKDASFCQGEGCSACWIFCLRRDLLSLSFPAVSPLLMDDLSSATLEKIFFSKCEIDSSWQQSVSITSHFCHLQRLLFPLFKLYFHNWKLLSDDLMNSSTILKAESRWNAASFRLSAFL